MGAILDRRARLRELERGILRDRYKPAEEVGLRLRLVDEAVRNPVDSRDDTERPVVGDGRLQVVVVVGHRRLKFPRKLKAHLATICTQDLHPRKVPAHLVGCIGDIVDSESGAGMRIDV